MRITLLLVLFAACSPYSPDLPAAPFLCGSATTDAGGSDDGRCPDGYMCMDNGMGTAVCVKPNGTIPVDASNGMCADDSTLEPNNTIMQAFQTPVTTSKNTLTFAGLAICPAGDKDTYAIQTGGPNGTTSNQNLELIVEYEDGGAALQASILNSGGIPIANASPKAGATNTIRAYVPNLPIGTFYAQVYGPGSGSVQTNNYKMTINVCDQAGTAPCTGT